MDHCQRERRKPNPRETANIFSFLTFAYVGGLFRKAGKADLTEEDIFEVITNCKSKTCGDYLEQEWINEKKLEKHPSLVRVLWNCYGLKYLLLGFIDFVVSTARSIMTPYFISHLVGYFSPGQTTYTREDGYFYGYSYLIYICLDTVYNHQYLLWVQTLGMEMRTAFASLLYRKALRLSPVAVAETSLGNIVTLITRDVQSFVAVIFTINDLWIAITQTVIICYMLYSKIGVASFVGIGVLLSSIPLQILITTFIAKCRLAGCKKTDERLQLTQEILTTIKIIKMYTWENFFSRKVSQARKVEMKKLTLAFYLKRVLILNGIIFTNLGFFMVILATIWTGVSTDTTVIFFVLSNFRYLRGWLGGAVPFGLGLGSEFVASFKRISKALNAEELNKDQHSEQLTEKPRVELDEISVQLKGEPVLDNVSLTVTSGLTMITGAVGSGKSSILKVILKDLPLIKGFVETQGRISYASQDPWLFPSSIRQNILFGEPYNAQRYQEVVKACALLFDFNLFENGDETILTDNGQNLSKGQQARINLARAVYRNSDIYLLDDSLTALDASVQDHIFHECIQKFLKGKICILVCQTASQIKEADNVIIMENGRIKDMGKPTARIIQQSYMIADQDDSIEKEVIHDSNQPTIEESSEKTGLIEAEQSTARTKIYKEQKKEGSVDWYVYKKFMIYGGGVFLILLNIFMRGFTQFTTTSADRLLTKWVDKKQAVMTIQNSIANISTEQFSYMNITLETAQAEEHTTFRFYYLCLLASSSLELLTTWLLLSFCKTASINIHKALVYQINNSVMRFFDTHLIGNILTRFSQDMMNIDESIAYNLDQFCRMLFSMGGILTLTIFINPAFAVCVIVVTIMLFWVRSCYLPAGRSMKRLEASSRSPMLGHLNATLEGLTTVRASNVQSILIEEYDRHLDLYTSANFTWYMSSRAFGFFVDMLSNFFLIFIIMDYLFFKRDITAGDIGLSLTQISQLSIVLTWGIRVFTELENHMTSLERVIEYTNIKTEKKDGTTVQNWPSTGSISYQNVYLAYGDSDSFVLKNLNFEIKPGEKIGVVGRTGAGKSSILATLFRLYEVKGKIIIDGVDIKTLALDYLRKNIVVIPQDPILFSGTIRSNLDPLNEFEDKDLWHTLERVGINTSIASLEQPINSSVMNFSSGQKQLLCLARAILRKNKLVVMDEATANMDHETDRMLHKIISDNFADCTVLTIAHRLHSVLVCDKVMVLDRGEMKEFDQPQELLKNRNGMFYKMVKQAGLLNYLDSK
ncbi:ATP binding cassette (ABC) transporter subfamily C member [Diabrotica virgifera virgifera]|uniref:Probable multidrug resistance-associated protein lethal(2)03659 n=1 Tax=Diabrotica virgifera virgifera TaxID=50390 RepID=A0A6P7HAN0_DIAVI|nr:ATP binding cassette (ABC) transporter subfamily C member [Diabrotica virgifera virgifera]